MPLSFTKKNKINVLKKTMTKILKTNKIMCLQIYKAIKLLTHYWWNRNGIVTLENSFQFLKKLNTHLLRHL